MADLRRVVTDIAGGDAVVARLESSAASLNHGLCDYEALGPGPAARSERATFREAVHRDVQNAAVAGLPTQPAACCRGAGLQARADGVLAGETKAEAHRAASGHEQIARQPPHDAGLATPRR